MLQPHPPTTALAHHSRQDDDDLDAPARARLAPASQSYLEPRGEGILFAVLCLLASIIIYAGVLLLRFLG